MQTDQSQFGGGATETILHPIVLVAMILAIILILVLPRKYVVVPILFISFLVPVGQQVVVGGVHWFVFRIIILFGLLRLLRDKASRTHVLAGGFNTVDRAFMWCTIVQAVAIILRLLQMAAFVNQCGFLLDSLGGYFLFRSMIEDEEDIRRVAKCFALLTCILAVSMLIEQIALVNVFGGIPPEIREGRIRSRGTFAHQILAGTFGATLLPLFFLLWKNSEARFTAAIGMVGASVMTATSNASTSLLAYAGGILAVCFWPIRSRMRAVRWGIVICLVALQLVMKAPFWFVIAHIEIVPGSSSWHRAAIVDLFIRHFSNWWLIGTKEAGEWGFGMWDTQNQFVSIGESGGLAALVLIIMMISHCFRRLGQARKVLRGDNEKEWILWFLGAALFSHVVGFFGVNYFDQTVFAWFAVLAMISAATAPILQERQLKESAADTALDDTLFVGA